VPVAVDLALLPVPLNGHAARKWKVTVYGVTFLPAFHFQCISDATVIGEDLVAGKSDNLAAFVY
jgi:hypothetical protein